MAMKIEEISEALRRIESGEPFNSVFGYEMDDKRVISFDELMKDSKNLPSSTPRGIPDKKGVS